MYLYVEDLCVETDGRKKLAFYYNEPSALDNRAVQRCFHDELQNYLITYNARTSQLKDPLPFFCNRKGSKYLSDVQELFHKSPAHLVTVAMHDTDSGGSNQCLIMTLFGAIPARILSSWRQKGVESAVEGNIQSIKVYMLVTAIGHMSNQRCLISLESS